MTTARERLKNRVSGKTIDDGAMSAAYIKLGRLDAENVGKWRATTGFSGWSHDPRALAISSVFRTLGGWQMGCDWEPPIEEIAREVAGYEDALNVVYEEVEAFVVQMTDEHGDVRL